jgi:dipeptidyl aminopeptidase/acylaminoacyl peptidase
MIPRTCYAAVLAIPLMLLVSRSVAQEKTGTAQDVQKRLKAAQKPHGATPLDNVIATLFATHNFQQAAISPDGNAIAWVEEVHSKNGVVSGSTVIYMKNLKSGAPPRRISAGVADSLHAESDVTWSPDSQKIAFLSDAAKRASCSSTSSMRPAARQKYSPT